MNFDEYQDLALSTANKELDPKEALINWVFGLMGEVGEFINAVKQALFHGHPLSRGYAVRELGDILWYIAALCAVFGVTLEEVAQTNVEKLRDRYPEGFSEEASRNREA